MTPAHGRKLTFVLGVHRSGTSALTSALYELGMELGHEPKERSAENEDGYFEHEGFRQLNESILSALHTTWDNWALTIDDVEFHLPSLRAQFEAAALALLASFPGSGPMVLKDPRTVTLWSFWRDVATEAGYEVQALIILRHPKEMVRSQITRFSGRPRFYAGLTATESVHALWTIATHRLLTRIPAHGACLALHKDMLTDPEHCLTGIARLIGLEDIPAEKQAAAVARIRPSLYRERIDDLTVQPSRAWEALSCRLFEALAAQPCPRHLSRDEAMAIADAFPEVSTVLPYLAAVRDSFSSLRANLS